MHTQHQPVVFDLLASLRGQLEPNEDIWQEDIEAMLFSLQKTVEQADLLVIGDGSLWSPDGREPSVVCDLSVAILGHLIDLEDGNMGFEQADEILGRVMEEIHPESIAMLVGSLELWRAWLVPGDLVGWPEPEVVILAQPKSSNGGTGFSLS